MRTDSLARIISSCLLSATVIDLQLKETNFTRLCLNKTMMTVNDSFPGPTIYVHRGDTLYVNVHNRADFGVTLHW